MHLAALFLTERFCFVKSLIGLGLQIFHLLPHPNLPFAIELLANPRDLLVDDLCQADRSEVLFLILLVQISFGRPQGDDFSPQAYSANYF